MTTLGSRGTVERKSRGSARRPDGWHKTALRELTITLSYALALFVEICLDRRVPLAVCCMRSFNDEPAARIEFLIRSQVMRIDLVRNRGDRTVSVS